MLLEKLIYNESVKTRSNQIGNYLLTDYCAKIEEVNENISRQINDLSGEINVYLPYNEKIKRFFQFNDFKVYCAIIAICSSLSILALIITKISITLFDLKHDYFGNNLFMLIIINLICSSIATLICAKITTTAEGSGIPEIKTILSGVDYYDFMEMRTFIAKYISILFVKVSGLGIGFEAAFVHITACIGENITQISFFKDLRQKYHDRRLVMSASVCAGIVIVFGAPIGGIIFTIETIATNFQASHIFKSFVGSTVSFFCYVVLDRVFGIQNMEPMSRSEFKEFELYHFAILGLLIGLLTTLYLNIFGRYLVFKRNTKLPLFNNRYYYIIIITLLISVLNYPHKSFQYSFKSIMYDLIEYKDLTTVTKSKWWRNDNWVILELIYIMLVRIFDMICFTTAAIPSGIYTPGFALGTIMGRLYGEIANRLFGVTTNASVFAAASAGAFTSALTKTFCPLIIVLEMTGKTDIMLPMLITIICAFSISGIFNIGYFEFMIAIRKLPSLNTMVSYEKAIKPVSDIMSPIEYTLNTKASLYDLVKLLSSKNDIDNRELIPFVKTNTWVIIGYANMIDLVMYLKRILKSLERYHSATAVKPNKYPDYCKMFSKIFEENVKSDKEETLRFIFNEIHSVLNVLILTNNKFYAHNNEDKSKRDRLEEEYFFKDSKTSKLFNYQSQNLTDRLSLVFSRDTQVIAKEMVEKNQKCTANVTKILNTMPLFLDPDDIGYNPMPLRVYINTKMIQVHYLFIMLHADEIFIENLDGDLVGKLSLKAFLSFKTR